MQENLSVDNNLDWIVDQMLNTTKASQSAVERLKLANYILIESPHCKEEKIINQINPIEKQSKSFAGVDSGFVTKQLNFANVTIIKEVGVVFNYSDGKLDKAEYFPRVYNLARPYLTTSALDLEEIMWNSSILRLDKEISLASLILGQKSKLDFMILDGSIIPQYLNKPTKECPSRKSYDKLITKFIELFNLAKEKKCYLVGCVEDCRANRFYNILKDELEINKGKSIQNDLYDSFVVFCLLDENQRTCVFNYSSKPDEHPVLKDFPEAIRNNIYVCYAKLSNQDYPLRIEFAYFKEFGLSLHKFAEEVVNNVASISCFNRKYTYPSVLIEADMRSRLKLEEINLIMNRLLQKTRVYGFRLPRRESRIF